MPSDAFKKALAQVNKVLPRVVKDAKEAGKVKYLKTESPRYNYVVGGGKGIAIGRIHRLGGPESGGKSTIATWAATQFQKHLKEQLGLDKPYTIYLDFERSFDVDHAEELGLKVDDSFIFMQPDTIEDAGNACEPLVKTGEVACIIFDSESMAAPRSVFENEVGKANFGSGAKVLGDFLKRFAILCGNYETTMFVISQERAQTNVMSHAIQYTGGYMLKYAASTLNRVRKIDEIRDGSKLVGIHMNVRNYKNKTGIPWRDCDMDLYFNGGFDPLPEYVDFIKEFKDDERLSNIVKLGGAYYSSEKYGFSICGKEKFVAWARDEANAEAWNDITSTIDSIIDGVLKTDRTEEEALAGDDVPDEYKEKEEHDVVDEISSLADTALAAASEVPDITLSDN